MAIAIAIVACGAGSYRPSSWSRGSYCVSGSAYAPGVAPAAWDTVDVVFTMNPAMDHADNAYDAAVAAADHVYQLGVDDPSFAYAMVDPTLTGDNTCAYLATYSQRTKFLPLFATDNKALGSSTHFRPLLMHFDPKVPAGATVVSAQLHVRTYAWYCSANTDSVRAMLMDRAGWDAWYAHRTTWNGWQATPTAPLFNYNATCSYAYQVQVVAGGAGNNNNHGYLLPNASAWSPALSSFTRAYDYGSVMDITGTGYKNGDSGAETNFAIDMTDCVQAIANGSTNNGIAIVPYIANASSYTLLFYGFEATDGGTAAATKLPWISVRYITKRYQAPLPGGKTWAFVFQTDDARKAFNDSCDIVFRAHGGKYTIYATESYLGTTGIGTFSDLLTWHDNGHEIGLHGKGHRFVTEWRLNYYPYAATDTTTYRAAWDSMAAEFAPAWLFALSDGAGRTDLRGDRRWGKSMALPGNGWSPWTVKMGARLGYSTVRCGGNWDILGAVANYGAAFADTAMNGRRTATGRAPRNILMLPFKLDIDGIVGPKGNRGVSESWVKQRMRDLVKQVKGDGNGVLSLYAHDTKATIYYPNGIDMDELGWLLDVVDEEGGGYMTATEYGDWMRASSTPVARPSSAHRDSVDLMGLSMPDGVWIKPDGVDNRWILGVK